MLRKFRRFISHFISALLSLMITLVVILGALYTYMELQLPNVAVLKDVHMQVPLKVYTSDGKLMAQYGAKRRIPVSLSQIPKPLVQAVVATEDARFYTHPGVDFISIIRAARAVIKSGRKVQGASTITMQVARNFFLTRKKTYIRKIKEILLALKIDKELSKDKILELYLNKVYFGNRAYGVAAASRVYYGKPLNQLTLAQMAMIAGLPQAPSRNNPIANPKGALKRRNHVLWRMYDTHYITKQAYLDARNQPVTARYHGERVQVRAPYVAEMVRQVMVAEYGKKAYDIGLKVYTTISSTLQSAANRSLQNGLIQYSERHGYYESGENLGSPATGDLTTWENKLTQLSTVNSLQPAAVIAMQDQSITVLLADGSTATVPWSGLSWARPALKHGWVGRKPKQSDNIVKLGDVIWLRKVKGRWHLSEIPKVQGAIVAVHPEDGAILALSGGFDYSLSNFNRATQAQRQPGSNFKPFIYSAALAKGFTLASIINDAPIVVKDPGENALWRPLNDTQKFYGPTRVRVGLTESRNIVSIRLLQDIGVDYAVDYASRFGFNPKALPHSLSLALGSASVTPLQVAAGYSVFANGGFKVRPYFISKVVAENNTVLYLANPPKACETCLQHANAAQMLKPLNPAPEVITPQNAYLMTQAMRGVIQNGTGRAARVLGRTDLAGKTGTTNNQVDAWFSGFNNQVEATVWVGFDNMQPTYEYGAQAALPIWIQFMHTATHGMPESVIPEPSDIVSVRIDKADGLLANPNQPDTMFEYFRKRYEPHSFTQTVGSATPEQTQSGENVEPVDQQLF